MVIVKLIYGVIVSVLFTHAMEISVCSFQKKKKEIIVCLAIFFCNIFGF